MPRRPVVALGGRVGAVVGAGGDAGVPRSVARWFVVAGFALAVAEAVLAVVAGHFWAWRAAGGLAPLLLAVVWWRAWRGAYGGDAVRWLPLEVALVVVVVAGAGDPLRATALVYVGVGLWSLSGQGRVVWWAAGAYGAALVAGASLAPGAQPSLAAGVLLQLPVLTLAVAVLQTLAAAIAQQRERAEDALALDRARATLAAAAGAGADGWARAAADAGLVLAGVDATAGVFFGDVAAGAPRGPLPLVAGRGVGAGAVADLARLSEGGRAVLAAGRALTLTAAESAAVVSGCGPLAQGSVWAATVGVGVRPHGLLLVGAPQLRARRAEGLAEIAATLSAGLEGAARLERTRRTSARTTALWRHCAAAVALVDEGGVVRAANPAFVALLGDGLASGAAAGEVSGEGSGWRELVHPADQDGLDGMWATLMTAAVGAVVSARLRVRHLGDWLAVECSAVNLLADPDLGGVVLTLQPAAGFAEPDALRDPLTGLSVEALFLNRLDRALEREGRQASSALLLLEVTGEGAVGAERRIGDLVRLDLRERDSVCFLGDGRFAVLLEAVGGAPDAARVAQRLRDRLGNAIGEPAMVGVCLAEAAGGDVGGWLVAARGALEAERAAAMRSVTHGVECVLPERVRRGLEPALRLAIEREEFAVYYQPTVALENGRLAAVEALVRWRHPDRGVLAPPEFFAQLEDSGLILPIGWWVLRQACAQVSAWHRKRPTVPPLAVHVNLSVRQLRHPGLADEVDTVLGATGLPPSSLVLELPESALARMEDGPGAQLAATRNQGVRLAVDDFGSGEASLERLAARGVDIVKIDKIDQGLLSGAAAGTMLALGKSLGLDVVAVGVERREQAVRLYGMGCRFGQGHFFARPLGQAAMEALLVRPGGIPEWSLFRPVADSSAQSVGGG